MRTHLAVAVGALALAVGCSSAGSNAGPAATAGSSTATGSPSPGSSVHSTSGPVTTVQQASGGPVPSGFAPASVTFVSAEDGWVLGTAPCTSDICTSIVRTTDGGRHWTGVPAPRSPYSRTDGVTTLRFADRTDGFAFGAALWATHDGAQTWHRVSMPGEVDDLVAAGDTVYASVSCTGGCHEPTTVYRSPAGVDHWEKTSFPGAPGSSRVTLVSHGQDVWAVSGKTVDGTGFWHTSGDGQWQPLPDPCTAFGQLWRLQYVAPTSATDLYLLCAGGVAAGSQPKQVLHSTDAGRHAESTGGEQVSRTGDVEGLTAAPAGRTVLVSARSGASVVYRSPDGARHWSQVLSAGDGGLGYHDVGFTTAQQAVAVHGSPTASTHQLLISDDAGAHWNVVHFG